MKTVTLNELKYWFPKFKDIKFFVERNTVRYIVYIDRNEAHTSLCLQTPKYRSEKITDYLLIEKDIMYQMAIVPHKLSHFCHIELTPI
jgi:hypothetical protein